MKTCNDDCLHCPLPRCKHDEKPEEPKQIIVTDYTDRRDYLRQYFREYYRKHKEQIKKAHQKYRKAHRDKVNELRRASYHRNREKELERQKKYILRKALNNG